MTRAEHLGLSDSDYQFRSSLHYIQNALSDPGYGPPDNVYGQVSQLILYCPMAVVACALQDDPERAREYATMSVQAGLEYFFGAWRDVPQRTGYCAHGEERMRKGLGYVTQYLSIVRMCGIMGDWESAKRLSEYPDRRLCRAPDGDSVEENSYVFLLCGFLLGDFHADEEDEDVLVIRSRRSKRYKLLASLLVDVSRRDSEAFNRDLHEYLNYFKKREFRQNIPQMQCQDGSFWISCARHVGMSPDWKREFDDFLILL